MILSKSGREYFQSLSSLVLQSMAANKTNFPYLIENDPFFIRYECIRQVWTMTSSIKEACSRFKVSRSTFYDIEKRFLKYGLPGLLSIPKLPPQVPELEQLVLLAKKSRPSLSYTSIHRIAQALPLTQNLSKPQLVSGILQSHGYGLSNMKSDLDFWGRIQRTLHRWSELCRTSLKGGRDPKKRKTSFLVDQDPYHNRLELLRELFLNPQANPPKVCLLYGVSIATLYRLATDYKLYGPWAVIPAHSYGREGLSSELQLTIILEKLRHPDWSAEWLVKQLKLRVSRFAVHRVICRWGLEDKDRLPVALDEYLGKELYSDEPFKPPKTAYHLVTENAILATGRINRHFELICQKMKTRPFHICDPGPLLLAPFVNNLGIVQAFETYGPARLRGKEISNLVLLNVFRILAGYRCINHLNDNRDRAVALASGIGMYGSTSKYYEDTIDFKLDQLYQLRCDLVARAKELGLIEGIKIGFDFHFKEFYGKDAREKQLGKGPNKARDMVPGFRPHVAWDLASNVIISIAYFQGGVRATRILQQFCEQNIFPILDPLAIKEIYMDSEYTKEGDFYYLKKITCQNGDLFLCLKRNKQIKNLTQQALEQKEGWNQHDKEDESKAVYVRLPKTELPLTIVILRDRKTQKNIRCFGTTNPNLSKEEVLRKYRYRWLIENGIKDLVTSYFIDEVNKTDPAKIEFEFYCVMIARLAFEYYLKELGGKYLNKVDGNKYTLRKMRNLIFEKRNCTIEQDDSGNFILTLLDSGGDSNLEQHVRKMLLSLKEKGHNKVLWWNQRGIFLRTENQYKFLKNVRRELG